MGIGDDAVDYVESEAGPFLSRSLGGKKRRKKLFGVMLFYPGAVILDDDFKRTVLRHCGNRDLPAVALLF